MAEVQKDRNFGYIDTKGEVVIPCAWDAVSPFENGFCTVVKATPMTGESYLWNYLFGLMNTKGDTVLKPEWRTLDESYNNNWNDSYYNDFTCTAPTFSEGIINVQNMDGLWGFFNENGTPVGKAEWDEIAEFSDGFAVVKKNDLYGFINDDGKTVIEPQYLAAHSFSEGLAGVVGADSPENAAAWASTATADTLYAILDSVSFDEFESLFNMLAEANDLEMAEKLASLYLILLEGGRDSLQAAMPSLASQEIVKLIALLTDGETADTQGWGFIDHKQQMVIAPLYEQVSSFKNGLCDVYLTGSGWQIIDANGDIVYFK